MSETALFAGEVRRFVTTTLAAAPTRADRWTLMDGMGLTTLTVPEEAGGQGGGGRELAAVAEALGAGLADVAYLGPVCLARTVLSHLGIGGAGIDGLLLARTEDPGPGDAVLAGGTVSAPSPLLAVDADLATAFLVVAFRDSGEPVLVRLPVDAPGVSRRPVPVADVTRPVADVTLREARGDVVAAGPAVLDALDAARRAASLFLAAENLGAAQHCLDNALAHVTTRHTFGRPVGSFQSVKHRCADRWLELTATRLLLDDCVQEHERKKIEVSSPYLLIQ